MESVVTGKPASSVDYKSTPLAPHVESELKSLRALAPLLSLRAQLRRIWQRQSSAPTRSFEEAFEEACAAEDFFYGLPPANPLYFGLRIRSLDGAGPVRRDLTSLLRDQSSPPGTVIVAPGGAGKSITARKAYFDCLRGPLSRHALTNAPPQARAASRRLQPPALSGYLPIWLDLSRCTSVAGASAGSADFISGLITLAQGVSHLPLAGAKRWLEKGPRILLFAELDDAPAAFRTPLAKSLRAWQEVHGGSGHATIVTLRPPASSDPSLAAFRGATTFGVYGLSLPQPEEILTYFRNARELEVRVFSRLGLPRPERDFLGEYMNLERLVHRQAPAGEGLVLTPLLAHWLSLLRGAALTGVETLADVHRKIVEQQVAIELSREGALGKGEEDVCERIETSILGFGRLAMAMQAEAQRGQKLSRQAGREVLTQPEAALQSLLPPDAQLDGGNEWGQLACWSRSMSDWHAEELLTSSLLVNLGGTLDFSSNSLRAYFIGAVAMAPAGLKQAWEQRLLALFRHEPAAWELPARHLGGATTAAQLEELALAFLLAEPRAGLPRLLSAILRGRPRLSSVTHTLDALEDTLIKRSFLLGSRPDLLLQECHNGLYWSRVGQEQCRELAQRIRKQATEQRRGWFRLLFQPCAASTRSMDEHKKPVLALVALPDSRVVSAGEDGLVKLWDPKLGKVRTMEEHRGAVTSLLLLPDGRVVSASQDRTIKLWDIRGGAVTTLVVEGRPTNVLAFHPRCGLISGGQDNLVRAWDLRTGLSRTIAQHADQICALVVTPGGQVISSGADGLVKLWDPGATSSISILEHHGSVRALAVLSDGRVLSASEDRTIRLWEPVRGGVQVFTGHAGPVTSLAVRADGCFASGSSDRTVRLWNPRSGSVETLAEHTAEINAVAFLQDGKVVSASDDHTVRLWDPAKASVRVMMDHRDRVRALAAGADGRVLSAGNDGTVRAWDPTLRAVGGTTDTLAPVQCALCLPDGHLVSAGADGAVRLWDPRAKEPTVIIRHNGWVTCIAGTPDGNVLSGGADNLVKCWDAKKGRVSTMDFHTQKIWAVAACPGGLVASSSHDGSLKVWDPRSGAVKSMNEHEGPVWPLAVLPGGRIASGGTDKTVRLWDPRSGEVKTLGAHGGWVWALVPLPDGKLASCSADHTVRLWDTDSSSAWVMEEHTDIVRFLAGLPDSRVASAGFDKLVKVWDPRSGKVLTMDQHTAPILGLTALADGRVATVSEDGTLKLWHPDSGEVLSYFTDAQPTSIACPPGVPCLAIGCVDGSVSLVAVEPEATMARARQ